MVLFRFGLHFSLAYQLIMKDGVIFLFFKQLINIQSQMMTVCDVAPTKSMVLSSKIASDS